MADRIPLVLDTGEIAQLGSSDALVDQAGVSFILGGVGADDNAVLRANGTGGSTIQGSSASLDDNGRLTLSGASALETSGSKSEYLRVLDSTGAITFELTALESARNSIGLGNGSLASTTTGLQNVAVGEAALSALDQANNNTAVGFQAGRDITSGNNNISIGTTANGSVETGSNNVAIGVNSNTNNVSGSSNVLIGVNAGLDSASTVQSIGIGSSALQNQTTGDSNTAVGHAAASGAGAFSAVVALGANTLVSATGDSNTALGHSAGRSLTTGVSNVFVGRNSGFNGSQLVTANETVCLGPSSYSTGVNAIAIGSAANAGADGIAIGQGVTAGGNAVVIGNTNVDTLQIGSGSTFFSQLHSAASDNLTIGEASGSLLSSGSNNTALGSGAGAALSTGAHNTLVGRTAGDKISGGAFNTCIGSLAGRQLTTEDRCLAIGYASLLSATGSDLVGIGVQAGRSITTGSNSLFLGPNSGFSAQQKVDADNCIAIGPSSFTTRDNEAVLGANTVDFTILRGNVKVSNTDDAGTYVNTCTGQTTNASTINLTDSGGLFAHLLANDSCITFRVQVTAIRDDGSEGAGYEFTGVARRDGAAAPVAVAAFTKTVLAEDDATWDANVNLSTNSLRVQVSGAVGKTINWTASSWVTEANF